MREEAQNKAITILENNYQHMTKQINALENTVINGFADLKKDLKCMREESDLRYANKRIERVVDNLTWLVVSTVVLAGLALIIVK
jgi:hypothetical protein